MAEKADFDAVVVHITQLSTSGETLAIRFSDESRRHLVTLPRIRLPDLFDQVAQITGAAESLITHINTVEEVIREGKTPSIALRVNLETAKGPRALSISIDAARQLAAQLIHILKAEDYRK